MLKEFAEGLLLFLVVAGEVDREIRGRRDRAQGAPGVGQDRAHVPAGDVPIER